VQDTGARIAFGSDWSVSSANPFQQIEVALTRQDPLLESGTAFIPEERIDLASAIAAFTINAAYVNSHDDSTGSIETGKLADLIVIDRNLFEIDPREISEAEVLLTMFDGQAVYGEPGSL
jgi:predicted amidohydrolase YtcJ